MSNNLNLKFDFSDGNPILNDIFQNNSKDILIGSYLQQISLKIKPLQQLAFIVYQNKSFVQNEVKNMK